MAIGKRRGGIWIVVLALASGADSSAVRRVVAAARSQDRDADVRAAIRGQVVDPHTRGPVRGATIRATSPALPATRETLTDGDGRFEIPGLPHGVYALVASKRGFVSRPYGRRRSGDPPVPIVVDGASVIAPIEFVLARGGAIAGRVVDELGDPLDTIAVRALTLAFGPHGRRLRTVAVSLPTNDLGEYRIWGLPPGRYYVTSVPPDPADLGITPALVLDRASRAPTFFPGTTDISAAARVSVDLGVTTDHTDIVVRAAPAASIRGRVLSAQSDAKPGRRVAAWPIAGDLAPVRTGVVDADGTYQLTSVPAGEYLLRVSGDRVREDTGRATVVIAGRDLDGVDITTVPPGQLSGRLRAATAGRRVPPSGFRLTAISTAIGSDAGGRVPVRVDGTFRLLSEPGQVLLRLAAAPPGWTLRRVSVNGTDVTDAGIDLGPGSRVDQVEVTVTDDDPELVVEVTDHEARPVRDCHIVAFPKDRRQWFHGSRTIARGRPGVSGRYRQRLPSGEYFVAAVATLEPGDEYDSEILDRLPATAVRVTASTPTHVALQVIEEP